MQQLQRVRELQCGRVLPASAGATDSSPRRKDKRPMARPAPYSREADLRPGHHLGAGPHGYSLSAGTMGEMFEQ